MTALPDTKDLILERKGSVLTVISVSEINYRVEVDPHPRWWPDGAWAHFRQELAGFFPNMPIILMSQDQNRQAHYFGRKDIVDFLKTIRLDQIPWKTYHIY